MSAGIEFSWCLVSYALGCLTAGYYWVRFRTGHDLRREGSGSLGARNAARLTGSRGFVIVLLVDSGKGALAVGGARLLGLNEILTALCVVLVVAGHVWPVQLGFKGGKGIATSLGALLVLDPVLVGLLGVAFLPVYAITRSLTLGGLFAYLVLPAALWIIGRPYTFVLTSVLVAGIIIYAHRENLARKFLKTKTQPTK